MQVEVRSFKNMRLSGGTLIAGVPHVGIGGTLLTDFVLEEMSMDQVACVDADTFPPFAMIFRGRPRYPVRIHADPASKLAVLRSEISPLSMWTRPLATKILDWCEAAGIARVVALDGILAPPPKSRRSDGVSAKKARDRVWFVSTDPKTRTEALEAGLVEFDRGVLGGLPAMLLLEGRSRKMDIVVLLAAFHDPLDDAQAARRLGAALPHVVSSLRIDLKRLEPTLREIEKVVRALRDEAEAVVRHQEDEQRPGRTPMMYG